VRLRVRAHGPVMSLHRVERAEAGDYAFLGYWTSKGAGRLADPCRRLAWVALARVPRAFCPVRSHFDVPPYAPPGDGSGAREPRRPLPPSLTGTAARPRPGGD
jgi:hypothetical protein